jgi:hypothetical protein
MASPPLPIGQCQVRCDMPSPDAQDPRGLSSERVDAEIEATRQRAIERGLDPERVDRWASENRARIERELHELDEINARERRRSERLRLQPDDSLEEELWKRAETLARYGGGADRRREADRRRLVMIRAQRPAVLMARPRSSRGKPIRRRGSRRSAAPIRGDPGDDDPHEADRSVKPAPPREGGASSRSPQLRLPRFEAEEMDRLVKLAAWERAKLYELAGIGFAERSMIEAEVRARIAREFRRPR